jgi:DNA modification methylase
VRPPPFLTSAILSFLLYAPQAFAAPGIPFVVNARPDYLQFLEAKRPVASSDGFAVDPDAINPALKPHVRKVVQWALAGGQRAFFGRFGLQKTTWHIEIMRHAMAHTGLPALITLPLGARISFFKDAATYFTGVHAVRLNFIRRTDEIDPLAINLTNTETIREGKIDARRFGATTYDEGDILRNMGTAAFWAFTNDVKTAIRYRFVATATPDPQDYVELLAYAGYLGVMDVGEARTRFFQRDAEQADNLTLLPHMEDQFWLWVMSWAVFGNRPSDFDPSFSDEGYDLPPLDVRWHEVATDHRGAGFEASGQGKLLKDDATGVIEAAAEKRASIPVRIAKMMELRAEDLSARRLIWHHLNDERDAIHAVAPEVVTVTGDQDLEEREQSLIGFAEGTIQELAGKPVMIGSGGNYQSSAWQIHLGILPKFKDFIQSIHRQQRYGQKSVVRVDIIHTEAERETRRKLEQRWRQYDEQCERMAALMRKFGLGQIDAVLALTRTIGVERAEFKGQRFTLVRNDAVDETRRMEPCSVDLIVTSPPFAKQYRYTPSYNDFGHTDDDDHFFAQMDFLTPELFRVLKPGRNCVIHMKDRIVEGSRSGLGFQTVAPVGMIKTPLHFMRHGFAYLGTTFIICDVVRENSQTNRLGHTEQCKDGSRMGFGLVEYLHVFRKPQTDRSLGYADDPVVKLIRDFDHRGRKDWYIKPPRPGVDESRCDPEGYTLGQWQLDASGYWRSSGNRLLTAEEIARLPVKGAHRRWKAHCAQHGYDYQHHVALGDAMRQVGTLKPDFAVIPAHSQHPAVWTDVVRMRSLNTLQVQKGRVKHLCPLPLDIVERVIKQRSMPGELVFDPFAGLGTVPYCAVKLGRRGSGVDLSADYVRDGAEHCHDIEEKVTGRTLFDLAAFDAEHAAALEAAE